MKRAHHIKCGLFTFKNDCPSYDSDLCIYNFLVLISCSTDLCSALYTAYFIKLSAFVLTVYAGACDWQLFYTLYKVCCCWFYGCMNGSWWSNVLNDTCIASIQWSCGLPYGVFCVVVVWKKWWFVEVVFAPSVLTFHCGESVTLNYEQGTQLYTFEMCTSVATSQLFGVFDSVFISFLYLLATSCMSPST